MGKILRLQSSRLDLDLEPDLTFTSIADPSSVPEYQKCKNQLVPSLVAFPLSPYTSTSVLQNTGNTFLMF